MGRLDGKVAIVTGSTSGIGTAVAKRFAQEGASVVVSGRRADRGGRVAAEIVAAGGRAIYEQGDISLPEHCEALAERAKSEYGRVDILVNNAGIFPRANLEETTPEFWDEVMNANLKSAFFCTRAVVPMMREVGGGSIVNMGSMHPFMGSINLIAYGIAKGGLLTMTRKLALALARDRIRVNWITVGWVLTEKEIEVQAAEGMDLDELHRRHENLPMGASTSEDDIASACVYLCADSGRHVTGTDIGLDAGVMAHL